MPIPQGTGDGFAGLFTVDLPQTVKTGQEFDIVVRRIGKRPLRLAPPPPPPPPPPATPKITRARHRTGGNIDLPEPAAPARMARAEPLAIEALPSGSWPTSATSSAPSR